VTCHGASINNNPPLANCVVCHGRDEDAGGDVGVSAGKGRGLRQHHLTKAAAACDDCHNDTDHATTGSAPESVFPSFYKSASNTAGLAPCDGSEERFASFTISLDNDGDGLTDGADSDCATGAPDINLSPTSLAFGTVTVGSPSTLSFQIQNVGTATLTVTSITRTAGTSTEFTFSAPATPFTIPAGGSQTVQVTYTPTDIGADSGSLTIASDDPDEATVTLGVSGTGEAPPVEEPDINLDPTSLTFGTVTVGGSSILSFQIQNVGTATLTVSGITRTAGTSTEFTFSAPATPFTIAAGGSQTVQLDITSNDPDEATVTLGLSGTGVAAPEPDINLDPASLAFGTVNIGNSATLSANIQNLGNADLTVNSILSCVGTSPEFSFTADPTPIVIPGGGSRMVSVTYTPVDEGSDSGCLEISSDDPDEAVVELSLSGSGADQTIVAAKIDAPGAINGANRGLTPVEIEFDPADKDNGRIKIAEVQCGAARDDEMPRFIDPVRIDQKYSVALFDTRDLMLLCEDNTLVCEGTLSDGRVFMGSDELKVVRDVDRNRCRAVNKRVKRVKRR